MKQRIKKNPELFSFVWAAVIFILCATPGQYIPTANWLEWLSFDKWVHAGIFFILCTLLFFVALKREQNKTYKVFYFFASVTYGMLMEFMQAKFFSNRTADWDDVIANSAGCLMAAVFFKKLVARFFVDAKSS